MIKEKACKGQNKAIGYGCGNSVEVSKRKYGLCPKCYYEWYKEWLSTNGDEVIRNAIAKAKSNIKSKQKSKDRVTRDKLKTKSGWENDLQREINIIVRLIDKGYGCIATNALTGKFNSGHYLSIGSNPTLRFHLENIWKQSEHSNTWKSGDTHRYQEGIIKLYGSDYLSYLDSLKSIKPIKLSIDEIKEKIILARQIVKRLKNEDKAYSLQERVILRKEINSQIGIYN